jgi:type IV pilus assembly protein PilQ
MNMAKLIFLGRKTFRKGLFAAALVFVVGLSAGAQENSSKEAIAIPATGTVPVTAPAPASTPALSSSLDRLSLFEISDEITQLHLLFSAPILKDNISWIESNSGLTLGFVFDRTKNNVKEATDKLQTNLVGGVQVVEDEEKKNTTVAVTAKTKITPKIETTGAEALITLSTARPSEANTIQPSDENKEKAYSSESKQIKNIALHKDAENQAEVIIETSFPGTPSKIQRYENTLNVYFNNTDLAKDVQKVLNGAALNTVVNKVFPLLTKSGVKIVILTKGRFGYSAKRQGSKVIISIRSLGSTAPAGLIVGQQPRSEGKPVSLNFQNIEVRSLLTLISDFTGVDMIISDSIKGNISIHLNNIPWEQALNVILKSQGLAKRRVGNVLMVATREEIMSRELQELQDSQQVEQLAPLYPEVIQLHYPKAVDVANVLKDKANSLLSSRGQVSVDSRTNTLWIRDTSKNLREIRQLIERLDIPVRQVLIEARMVTIDKSFERDLGVRFGLNKQGRLGANLKEASQQMTGTELKNIPYADRLNFNLPAPKVGELGGAASIGLALFRVANGLYLDLELSALEKEGGGQVISNPRVITANQQAAIIETGEEIPYEESTSSGATSVSFKKAVLSLNITPQITPDNKIVLDLEVNEDQRGTESSTGVPAINTQHIKTQVLLNDGETVVLGGIYKQNKQSVITRVPFFGTLPMVGPLFRNTSVNNTRSELLIFVTPRVIVPSGGDIE